MFSRFAVKLRKTSTVTVDDLHEIIQLSYQPTPKTFDVDMLFDVKSWLSPCIMPLKKHVYPHAFKFEIGREGNVMMNYKAWSADESWMTEDGENILKAMPEGKPRILVPDYRKSPSVETLIEKCQKCQVRFNNQQANWWANYIDTERTSRVSWHELSDVDWPLDDIEQYDQKSLKQSKLKLTADQLKMDENLKKLFEKSNNCPKVC